MQVNLSDRQIGWLTSLARQDLRKKLRNRRSLEEKFGFVEESFDEKVRWMVEALVSLGVDIDSMENLDQEEFRKVVS